MAFAREMRNLALDARGITFDHYLDRATDMVMQVGIYIMVVYWYTGDMCCILKSISECIYACIFSSLMVGARLDTGLFSTKP